MSDSVPTTNYGNNAARDEVHTSAAAQLPDPTQQGQLSIRYEVGKASFSHLACWSMTILYDRRFHVFKSKPDNKYFQNDMKTYTFFPFPGFSIHSRSLYTLRHC